MPTSRQDDKPESANRVWPTECKHVRDGELGAIETITATTLPGHAPDFNYVKGPDTMRVCAFCAGQLWAAIGELAGKGKLPR